MQDLSTLPDQPDQAPPQKLRRDTTSTSLREVRAVLVRRRWLVLSVVGGLLLLCLLYCLIVPDQYEVAAKVALRIAPASSLSLDAADPAQTAGQLASAMQLETLANVFRSDQLAWRVITELRLYQSPAFVGNFARRFPRFYAQAPADNAADVAAQSWLLERFEKRLHVQTLPGTLLIQIRFRCRDGALSAAVVNALIRAYEEQENESHVQATAQAAGGLEVQLKDLKARVDRDQQRLSVFQRKNGILSTPDALVDGKPSETEHSSTLLEIDELGRQLVAATADRIQTETEYLSAMHEDPELVIASDPRLQLENGGFATALLQQIHAHRSELEEEQTQLAAEHGPNFPRAVEIRRDLDDLNSQKQAEDTKLIGHFYSAWKAASDREKMVRINLDQLTAEGMKQNQAAAEYAVMRQEADSSHELYVQALEKVDEARLAAGIHSSNISVVDYAREPVKPVAPDLPLYMAITLFAGLWLAVGGAFLLESLGTSEKRMVVALLLLLACGAACAQAPTPNTSGLPSGVVQIPQTPDNRTLPNPKEAPAVWGNAVGVNQSAQLATGPSASRLPSPIGPGDILDITESHIPEFHRTVRVSPAGTVILPMVNEVQIGGMDEEGAAHAIDAALLAQGMLLHPQVSVLVIGSAGGDVSVLGEVARPGVYPYAVHHRLLDLLAAAAGVTPNAGRLVNIFHRSDPDTPHPVVLDPNGTGAAPDHNPELLAGDTVQVSRAGLVYVIGDVIRPGGFTVDPVQSLTVVQALSLAWGPTQNAAGNKALLIREQKDGRTLTYLNLKRMLHGQDPDQPIHDGDILFVPDSMAKNLMNRTLESVVQSAVGVTIYAGLVYSQRF